MNGRSTDRRRRLTASKALPRAGGSGPTPQPKPARQEQSAPLDDLDVQIVGFLAADPRLSARAIARQLHVAPGTVSQRVNRLTESSIITGYRMLLNAAALGYEVHAILGLQTDQGPLLDDAIDALLAINEVEAVHIVTGQWDLLAELRLRDHAHLLEVLRGDIYQIPGFRHVETMISLMTHSRPHGWLPLELQLEALPGTAGQ